MPETLTTCPICASPNIYTRSKAFGDGHTPVSVCKDCDQHFVNPRMTDAEATAFYSGAYWDKMNGARSQENLIRHRERARTQVLEMDKWLTGLNTALEIGCSLGYLLDQLARGYDMDVRGVEPDTRNHQAEPAKRYTLYTDIAHVPCIQFDLIAMSHSLEHLNRPSKYLEHLAQYYAHPGTRFMIEVPNLDAIPNTLTQQHPFAFTEKTLNQLMAWVGLEPLQMVKHGLGSARPLYLLGMYGRKP